MYRISHLSFQFRTDTIRSASEQIKSCFHYKKHSLGTRYLVKVQVQSTSQMTVHRKSGKIDYSKIFKHEYIIHINLDKNFKTSFSEDYEFLNKSSCENILSRQHLVEVEHFLWSCVTLYVINYELCYTNPIYNVTLLMRWKEGSVWSISKFRW